MRTRVVSNAAALLAGWTLLSACGSDARGTRETAFTFSGTSFAGEVYFHGFYDFSASSVPRPFHREFFDAYGDCGAPGFAVDLLIPGRIYAGPGTYACGTDPYASYADNPYCTITVQQSPDCVAVGEWTTYGVRRPDGLYGELPGCSITVAEDGVWVSGSAACGLFSFRSLAGTHPDAGRSLGVSGYFNAR